MTLSDQINEDLKAAMKSRDQVRLDTIRSIRAQIVELSKRGTGKDITVEEELSVLMTAVKKRKEAIEMYEKGGRKELADQERREIEIINFYLPKQITLEEAENLIKKIISDTGSSTMKDLGKVMPLAMKELKGRIEGKIVQDIVKQKLGG